MLLALQLLQHLLRVLLILWLAHDLAILTYNGICPEHDAILYRCCYVLRLLSGKLLHDLRRLLLCDLFFRVARNHFEFHSDLLQEFPPARGI